jgi:hypothetical protein
VQNADEPVGEPAQRGPVADVTGTLHVEGSQVAK